jgi:hypothetical protein
MSIFVQPPYDPDQHLPKPETETEPQRQEDLWRYRFPWIKTAISASPYNDSLAVENRTSHAWMLWHRYHALGSIAPKRKEVFRLVKTGLITARQYPPPPRAEHIVLELAPSISAATIVDVSGGEGFYAFQVVELETEDDRPGVPRLLPIDAAIEELGLAAHTENALKRAGITQIQEVASMNLGDARSIPGVGSGGLVEIIFRLARIKLV